MQQYELIRSSRKTLAIELRPGGRVIVRAPLYTPRFVIDRAVAARDGAAASSKDAP